MVGAMTGDVVVVGSGAAGMTAALTVVDGGASVILLEKMHHLGGSSNFAEGMFGVETEMQSQNYISITRDEAFRIIMDYSHWKANPRLARAFVDESAATITWLERLGVQFVGPRAMWYDSPRTWHVLKGPKMARASVMMKVLAAHAREKGVDICVGITAKRLIKKDDQITGIIAEISGRAMQVNARAVFIATGGYANNSEWIKKYTGFDLDENLFPLGNTGKMGDGIRLAWEAGAAEDGLGTLQLVRVGPLLGPGGKFKQMLEPVGPQPSLYVNQHGERYFDESVGSNFVFDANALARQKGKCSYNIFDEAAKRDMMEKGIVIGLGMMLPVGSRFTRLDEALKALQKEGNPNVFAADSIEGLALKMGINPAVLKATVDEYNAFCEKGHDDLFAKDPRYLRPLKGPKFYAIRSFTAFLGTLGGIKINHKMEVVDREENVIPGLYAGGVDAGGLYGDSYDVFTGGSTLGFAVNSGRIAGKNILQYLGK